MEKTTIKKGFARREIVYFPHV